MNPTSKQWIPTSVSMMMPKTAKKVMTMRKDMLVRSREPHVPFLLRFFETPELFFFDDSFEYIFFFWFWLDSVPPTQTLSPQLIFPAFGRILS